MRLPHPPTQEAQPNQLPIQPEQLALLQGGRRRRRRKVRRRSRPHGGRVRRCRHGAASGGVIEERGFGHGAMSARHMEIVSLTLYVLSNGPPHWNNCRTRLLRLIFFRRYAAFFLSKRVEFFSSPPIRPADVLPMYKVNQHYAREVVSASS